MEIKSEFLTKENLKRVIDLTPENVEKVFEYATTNENGEKILSNDADKYDTLIKEVNICGEPNNRFPTTYFDLLKLQNTDVCVANFLRQTRIAHLNKGLSPEDERFTKLITFDYAGLRIFNGTNGIKMKDGEGIMKYASALPRKTIAQMLSLAIGHKFIEPLKETEKIDKEGNHILVMDSSKGIFRGMVPIISMETKKFLEESIMSRMQKPTPPTAPSGQGEDGGRE